MEKLTIVTVSYNDCLNLEKTILSVINQEYDSYEYIIIDGGSNDGTKDILNRYANRIDFFLSEPDDGIYNAMNKALKYVHGEWILYMNSGDTFVSSDTISKIFQHSIPMDVSVIYGNCYCVFEFGKILSIPADRLEFSRTLPFNHQSAAVRTSVMKEFLFDESYKILADMELFLRLYRLGYKFMHIDTIIANYYIGGISEKSHDLYFGEVERIKGTIWYKGYYIRKLKYKIKSIIKKMTPNFLKNFYRVIKYKNQIINS